MVHKQQPTDTTVSRPNNASHQRMKSSRESQQQQEPARSKDQRSVKRHKKEVFRFGCQNVRTLNNRRSALVVQALEGGRCDIVALSETRLADIGEIQEGAMVIYYSGNATGGAQQGKGGVGIALSEKANKLLAGKPEAVSSCILGTALRS